MDPEAWIQVEQTYAAIVAAARVSLTRLVPADTVWPADNVLPFLAALLLAAAAADPLPRLAAREAPPGVVPEMELLRAEILTAIEAILGDDDGIPPAFHAAAQRVAEQGHRMQWMTWGSPPRCANAGCVHCGRALLIVRTRHGQFRLEGTALKGCVRPKLVPLDVASPERKTA